MHLAHSGRHDRAERCPLLGVKRTSAGHSEMSAYDPKRTLASPQGTVPRHLLRTNRTRYNALSCPQLFVMLFGIACGSLFGLQDQWPTWGVGNQLSL
jgi:hypothetical protein